MNLKTDEWLLEGLDGGNPLGFLAAVGALRTATMAWPAANPTLRWEAVSGAWRPALSVKTVQDKKGMISGLHQQLRKMADHSALKIGDDINFTADAYRAFCCTAQDQIATDSIFAEFLASFASEAIVDEKSGQIADTAFRTMRGAGHQHFLKTMRNLAALTTEEHLEQCLFSPWAYSNVGMSLRLDPVDDRRYALRWKEPSKDPGATEWGANRLAIEALPLFPVQSVAKQAKTTGFVSRKKQGTFFTWPIWCGALTMDVVRSAISLSTLQPESPARQQLDRQGIVGVYRCQRITLGKFRNFTAAVPV